MEALHVWLQQQVPRLPGGSGLTKAMRYALRHWEGRVMIDNPATTMELMAQL